MADNHTHSLAPVEQAEHSDLETLRKPLLPKAYTVRGLWDLVRLDRPPTMYLWNGIAHIPGSVIEIIGPPSIGKSRFIGDLSRHQILGQDFGDLPTHKIPLKWLFVGSENGINRLDRESKAYILHCSPEKVKGLTEDERFSLAAQNGFTKEACLCLNENFRTFTLEEPEDYDISLLSEDNVEKLKATLEKEQPQILVADPWGDIIAGKELDDGDVRSTIRILRRCLADAGLKDTIIIIVNHARMGVKEEAAARGSEEGNFGKNSKCLYSIARYVINIRRASTENNPPIEVICAKNNDGAKPPPIALRLEPTSMSYERIKSFDHDAWQAELEEAAGLCKKKNDGKTRSDQEHIWEAILSVLSQQPKGVLSYKDLIAALRNIHGIGKTAAENYISTCVNVRKTLSTTPMMKEGIDGKWTRNGNAVVYGQPAQITAYKTKHLKGGKCSTDHPNAPNTPNRISGS